MSKHPIDEALDLDPSEEVAKVFGMNITLPEDPTLRTVVEFALQQYKDLVQEAQLFEGEGKLKNLELAKEYLNLAKDTMHKESDLQIKARNAEIRANGKKMKTIPADDQKPEGGGEYISREDLLKQLRKK